MQNASSTSPEPERFKANSLQVGRAFSFMFEDKNWVVKILLGAVFNLLTLVLVGIPFIFGYLLELAKNSSEGKELPLPEWDKLGDKFIRGLIYTIILIIYSIPGIILSFIPCVKYCFGPLYFLAFLFVLPYITIKYAQTGSFEEAFRFNEIFDFVKANLNNLVIVVLLVIALGIIALFGFLAIGIGWFFTSFWAALAISYLYGQVYREGQKEKPAVETVSS
jgi:hypothetical protein